MRNTIIILRRTLLAAAALAAAACILPQAELADDYCVNRAGCDASHTFAASDLQAALSGAAAGPGADRVLLGPGHYAPGTYAGPPTGSVEIAGAGSDQTIIDVTANGLIASGSGVSIHDLGFDLAPGAAFALDTHGAVSEIAVTGEPGATGAVGVVLGEAGAVSHASVQLPAGGTGIRITGWAAVADSRIEVGTAAAQSTAVEVTGSVTAKPVSLMRLRLTARDPLDASSGTTRIADSLLDMGSSPYTIGIWAHSAASGLMALVQADRVTIVGHAAKSDPQTGIRSEASGAGATVGLNIENSIISGPIYSAVRVASAGYSAIGMHHIAYTPGSSFADVNTGAGTDALQQDVDTAIDPGFLDRANGDYHLRYDSPLIDRSASVIIPPGPTDLGGSTRIADGNGDGIAVADIGAFEYQRARPVVTAAEASPARLTIGQASTFSATISDADLGEPSVVTWTFGDGGTAAGATAAHTYSALGTYTVTVTAVDPLGFTGTRSFPVDVTPVPPPPAPPAAIAYAGGLVEHTAASLKLSGLHLTRSRFRHASFLPGRARSTRGGTTIAVTASIATLLTLRLVVAHGAATGVLQLHAQAGTNTLRFGGRLSRRSTLRAGRYTLIVTAPAVPALRARLTVLR